MIKTTIDPMSVEPLYKVTNIEKYESLLEEMKKNGWKNIPSIIVIETDTGYFCISGSHRYYAARNANLQIEIELYQENEIYKWFNLFYIQAIHFYWW